MDEECLTTCATFDQKREMQTVNSLHLLCFHYNKLIQILISYNSLTMNEWIIDLISHQTNLTKHDLIRKAAV